MNGDEALNRAILASIWERCQWDFLVQNPQLSDWLAGSALQATDDPNVFRLVVTGEAAAEWLGAHSFAIRRSVSVEVKRPVDVKVVAREAAKK